MNKNENKHFSSWEDDNVFYIVTCSGNCMHIEICGSVYNDDDIRLLANYIIEKRLNSSVSVYSISRGAICPAYSKLLLDAMPLLDRLCHYHDAIVLVSDYDNTLLAQSHNFSTNLTLVHVPYGRCNEKLPVEVASRFRTLYPGLNLLSVKASLLNSSFAPVPGHASCDKSLDYNHCLFSSKDEATYFFERTIKAGEVRNAVINLPQKMKSARVRATLCYTFRPGSSGSYNENDISFSFDGIVHDLNCVEKEESHGNVIRKQLMLDKEMLTLLDGKLNIRIVSRNDRERCQSSSSSLCSISLVVSIGTEDYKYRKQTFYNSINRINRLRNVDTDRYNYIRLPYIN